MTVDPELLQLVRVAIELAQQVTPRVRKKWHRWAEAWLRSPADAAAYAAAYAAYAADAAAYAADAADAAAYNAAATYNAAAYNAAANDAAYNAAANDAAAAAAADARRYAVRSIERSLAAGARPQTDLQQIECCYLRLIA